MKTRTWGLLILLGGVLFAHGPAWGAACVDGTTVAGFIALGATGCDNGDKRYVAGSGTSVLAAFRASTLDWDISGGNNSLVLDLSPAVATLSGTYTFDVDVAITNPSFVYFDVRLDSSCTSIPCTVGLVEDVPKFTPLTSTNGAPVSTGIPGGQTTLSMLETLTIGATANLASATISLTEQPVSAVPEPSTFIMLGIGLAALGVLRRSRLR